jgi:L-methionine (R)-S-oxide reductase
MPSAHCFISSGKKILMAESLEVREGAGKRERYASLLPQLRALVEGETDPVANMANCCAALRQTFGFFWVGFYIVKGKRGEGRATRDKGQWAWDGGNSDNDVFSPEKNELVLGPFQGDVACTRIGFGKGVCGAAWQRAETIIVPDVDAFPGHIACSSSSRSEIVVPIFIDGRVAAVLDVDSDRPDDFDDDDRDGLEAIATIIAPWLR